MNDLLVIDFEMCEVDRTVTKGTGVYLDHEIIQIGAVILNEKNRITDEYRAYVKPHYGTISKTISDLTGIIEMDVANAPELEAALKKFSNWIGNKEVTACSWSDSDEVQLSVEMEQKEIRNERISGLLEDWVDLQASYDKFTGATRSTALSRALKAQDVKPEGREHDGAADARNTALLIAKMRKDGKELEFTPLNESFEYTDSEEEGESAFGNIFANFKF